MVFFILVHFVQSQNINVPKNYIVYHTSEQIYIDGKANEISWSKVPWTDNFIDIEGVKKPTYRTRMKMMWDDANFYFYAELEEPHIWGDIT
ncbi:MAG: carbohydrate-binding family 9-like protein, partial [Flavobacteriaceae bacterium]|nr:carbohydrate-binding family 9-like protein [Flavobacteriaceae bacterium]